MLLVAGLLLVEGLLLLEMLLDAALLVDAALLGGADELVAAAVEDAGLAVPPMPAQALATARTSTAAELAPINLR